MQRRQFLVGVGTIIAGAAWGAPTAVTTRTTGPKHHYFGYYDKTPWNSTNKLLLCNEVSFADRQPTANDELTVGMIDLTDNKFVPLGTTKAWCWQQGTMLQWLPSAADRMVIHNGVEGDHFCAIIRDVQSGKTRTLPRPIYAVNPQGTTAVTLDFARLHRLRPGYGYASAPEKFADQRAPAEVGIWRMDIATGESKQIVTLAQLAQFDADDRLRGPSEHWVNHLQFAPDGQHFAFLHRWREPAWKTWQTRLLTCNTDGTGLKLVIDTGMVSHYDWRDDHTILAWTRSKPGDRFYLVDTVKREFTVMGEGTLTRDGHCSFSPDRQWVLNDTYPDGKRMQTLMLYHPGTQRRLDLGTFLEPAQFAGPLRCDLHPRWDRTGSQVCFDSTHDGTRQLYTLDVSAHVTPAPQ
jgi:hypothetical protein